MTAETMEIVAQIGAKIGSALARDLKESLAVQPTLTLTEAAKALNVSDETMRKLCMAGEIPYIRIDRLYRLKPSDINAYLEKHYERTVK